MILCPRCRKPLTADHECSGLTRRFFFGLFAGATAAMAIPDVWGKAELLPYGESAVSLGDLIYRSDRHLFTVRIGPAYGQLFSFIADRPQVRNNYIDESADRMLIVRSPRVPFWRRQQ